MPIEIKELHIKVAVSPPKNEQSGQTDAGEPSPCAEAMDREQIVADCVEQVMQILKDKGER
jgi:2,3-bisphosphoglycerate-independent phosphoglycerate mutase